MVQGYARGDKIFRKKWNLDNCTITQGEKTVGCKWVYTIKYNSDGTVEWYKAWLVAKGYTQTYGINY
jgi:hypothetical protein